MNKFFVLIAFLMLIVMSGCTSSPSPVTQQSLKPLNIRLQRFAHSQFAGYLIAEHKGRYRDAGLDVRIHPGGPDIKPQVMVAQGADDIGIGVPNMVITPRVNGSPLVAIAQVYQDSPNRYILKSKNAINSIADLKGKKIGLRMGGDEAEFVALLAKHGMSLQDVQLVHQGYSVEPFLQDSYDLAQVTMYNEIHLVRKALGSGDDIQVISPKDYGVDILGDMIFTRDDVIAQRSGELVKFLEQSMRGWQYVIDHPEESLEIILSKYPDLEKTQQQTVMKAVIEMITKGNKPLGDIQVSDYARAQDILYASKQIDKKLDPHVFVNESLIKQIQR